VPPGNEMVRQRLTRLDGRMQRLEEDLRRSVDTLEDLKFVLNAHPGRLGGLSEMTPSFP